MSEDTLNSPVAQPDLEAALAVALGGDSSPELSAAVTAQEDNARDREARAEARAAARESAETETLEAEVVDEEALPPWMAQVQPEAEEEEAEDATPVEGQQAQAQPGLLDRLAQAGVDLRGKYANEDEALRGVANAVRMVGQRDEYSQLGRQMAENPVAAYQMLQQRLAQQGMLQAPQQTQQQAPNPDQPPEWDPTWVHMLEQTEDGTIRSKPGFDPTLPQKYAAWNAYAAKRLPEIIRNDPGKQALAEVARIQNEFRQYIQYTQNQQQQYAQQQQAAFQQQQEHLRAAGWIQNNANWLFNDGIMEKGASPHARAFYQEFNQLRQHPELRTATDEFVADLTFQRLKAQALPLSGGNLSNRQGALSRPNSVRHNRTAPLSDNESLEDMLTRVVEANGIDFATNS